MPFDEDFLAPDIRSVLQAAAILDITEFDLFRLAFSRWHGEPAGDDRLEPYFVAYMFDGVVPSWVRHFARLVERRFRRGTLDPRSLGVDRLPGSREMVSRGMRYGVIIGLVLLSLVVLAEFAARLADFAGRCMFPPCY